MDWTNQKILVTGGTGSFWKKFIQGLLDEYKPEKNRRELTQCKSDFWGSLMGSK